MSLLKFSRSFWETAVAYKGSDPDILKHYDILSDLQKGKTWSQIQIKHGVCRQTIANIITKYKK